MDNRQSRRLPLRLIEQQRPKRERRESRRASLTHASFFRFRTRKHFDNRHHTGVISTPHEAITGTRSLHDDAWAPRQLLPPSRAARACCAGRCLASYILHSLWFPAQAPE
eukprot:scaffold137576_cov72-Phaeocystis_antarctica.AAC.2